MGEANQILGKHLGKSNREEHHTDRKDPINPLSEGNVHAAHALSFEPVTFCWFPRVNGAKWIDLPTQDNRFYTEEPTRLLGGRGSRATWGNIANNYTGVYGVVGSFPIDVKLEFRMAGDDAHALFFKVCGRSWKNSRRLIYRHKYKPRFSGWVRAIPDNSDPFNDVIPAGEIFTVVGVYDEYSGGDWIEMEMRVLNPETNEVMYKGSLGSFGQFRAASLDEVRDACRNNGEKF